MAVKKKSAVKKAVKKSPAKKTGAKKKSVAKKAVAKKAVAKKTVAKKTTTKKAVAKKTTVKKSAVKKSAVKKATALKASTPVNVSTTPAPVAAKPAVKAAPAKPSAAPRQGSSGKTLFAVLVAVVLLAAIVISNSGKDSDEAPATEPAVTESVAPEATESEAPVTADPAAATGEAPSRFIGNWKDSSKSVMVITWKAPAGDVTGYTIETRANMGEWKVVSEVSATTYAAEFAKTSADGSTSFRVTAVYADGSYGVAPAFGFAGQFE